MTVFKEKECQHRFRVRQEYLSGDCDCPQVFCAALNEPLCWEATVAPSWKTKQNKTGIFTVLTEALRSSFPWDLEKHKKPCWSSSQASWGSLCLHHPLSDTGAEEPGLPRAGRWTSAQHWGAALEQPAQLAAQAGKRAGWLCSGGRHSEQC